MKEVNYQGLRRHPALPHRCARTGAAPTTPDWHGVATLYARLQAIFQEGMDAVCPPETVATQCQAGRENSA